MFSQFISDFISISFDLLSFAIIARILLSWIPNAGGGRIREILHDVTEPILAPFRKMIPNMGMIDLSPLIAIIVLEIVRGIILQLIVPLIG